MKQNEEESKTQPWCCSGAFWSLGGRIKPPIQFIALIHTYRDDPFGAGNLFWSTNPNGSSTLFTTSVQCPNSQPGHNSGCFLSLVLSICFPLSNIGHLNRVMIFRAIKSWLMPPLIAGISMYDRLFQKHPPGAFLWMKDTQWWTQVPLQVPGVFAKKMAPLWAG